jgi:FixJ family two-component response regulator
MDDEPLIHIVDDDESLRTALLRLLRASGLPACGHGSAGDFLREAPRLHAGCVLLDMNLPDHSGLDLLVVLPRLGILLPVVVLTGHANEAARAWAMQAGAVDFLHKPVDRTTLLGALERALAIDAARRAAAT